MKITTRSAIDISESLASFLLASHVRHTRESSCDPQFEKRMKHVDTAKYTIADVYLPKQDCAIESKSIAHGNEALKGVIQASVYKEQTEQAIFCMQKPKRRQLRDTISTLASEYGCGVIWIVGIPTICAEETIKQATGGCTKPFELWKQNRYTSTREAIIHKSRSGWADEYIETLEHVVVEKSERIFDFAVKPDKSKSGLSEIHT